MSTRLAVRAATVAVLALASLMTKPTPAAATAFAFGCINGCCVCDPLGANCSDTATIQADCEDYCQSPSVVACTDNSFDCSGVSALVECAP